MKTTRSGLILAKKSWKIFLDGRFINVPGYVCTKEKRGMKLDNNI